MIDKQKLAKEWLDKSNSLGFLTRIVLLQRATGLTQAECMERICDLAATGECEEWVRKS